MKRFLVTVLAMSMAMGSIVLAAEPDMSDIRIIWVKREETPPVEKVRPYLSWENRGEEFLAQNVGAARIFLDGKEKELKYPLYRKQGQVMIAAEDLANVIDGSIQPTFSETSFALQADALRKPDAAVWISRQSRKSIQMDIYGQENAKAKKDSEGIWYIPLREMSEGILYDVTWKKMGDTEYFMLESPQMPQLTASASYDAETNTVRMYMVNMENKSFLYQYEYHIQKWDGEKWTNAPMNREVCYAYNEYELPVADPVDTIYSSRWVEYKLTSYEDGNGLSPGKYRIYKEIWEKNVEKPVFYNLGAEFEVE